MFITCQECGAQVPIEETNCPQCHYPIGNEYKKNYLKTHFEPIKKITDMSKFKYFLLSTVLKSKEVTIDNGGKLSTITIIKNISDIEIPYVPSNDDINDIIWDYYNDGSLKNLCIECQTNRDKDTVINAALCMASLCEDMCISVQDKSIYFEKMFRPWVQ